MGEIDDLIARVKREAREEYDELAKEIRDTYDEFMTQERRMRGRLFLSGFASGLVVGAIAFAAWG